MKKQYGFTTLFALLLLILGSIVVFLGASYSLKNAQTSSVNTHQSIQVQAHGWTGVEAIRQGLLNLGTTKISTLSSGGVITVSGLTGLKATVISNDTTNKKITVLINSCSSSSNSSCLSSNSNLTYPGATVSIQATYNYSSSSSPGGTNTTASYIVNIAGDLTLNGGITVTGAKGTVAVVVDGNISSGSGFSGIDTIYSTKDITISGGGAGGNSVLSAQGNITLTGSGTYGVVNAMGNIIMSGGTTAVTTQSNGTITLSNTSVTNATSIGNIYITGGGTTVTNAKTMGSIIAIGGTITNAYANGAVTLVGGNNTTINAIGNVNVTQGSFLTINTNGSYTGSNGPSVSVLNAITGINQTNGSITTSKTKGNHTQNGTSTSSGQVQGNFTESGWGSFTGTVGGTVTKTQQYNTNIHATTQTGLVVNITPVNALSIPALTATTIATNYVDAYSLMSAANYIFTYSSGKIMVKTNNVNGVPNSTYYLVQSYPYMDNICTVSNPTSASSCLGKIAIGYSDYNTLFTYNSTTQQWSLAGTSLAPGIAFFVGNLDIGSGTYYNTFISTGNITTSGASNIYAVNYASYNNICVNSKYSNIYPTQLCNKSTASYISTTLGNTALLAGSYTNGVFSGGNITLGASVNVYGNIVAGGLLQTGGATLLYGYITSANQAKSTTGNSLGGSTTINLNNLPTTYDPSQTVVTTPSTGSSSSTTTVIVNLAKYM